MLEDFDDGLKEVTGEREEQYTYSIRSSIAEEERRRDLLIRRGQERKA
jgi:hypothetical protein